MCVRVLNSDSKQETDTPVGFAEMLGVEVNELPVDNNYKQLIPHNCLCQVDLKKACEIQGFNYSENEDFDAVISKKSPQTIIQETTKYR